MKSETPHFELKINGMDCAEEVAILKRELGPMLGGVDALSFDVLNRKISITTKKAVSVTDVLEVIRKTGMTGEIWSESEKNQKKQSWWELNGRTVAVLISGLATAIGLCVHALNSGSVLLALGIEEIGKGHEAPFTSQFFYTLAALSGSLFVVPKAFYSLKKLRPDMNLLMVIAVVGAIGIGEWLEAATVSFLF